MCDTSCKVKILTEENARLREALNTIVNHQRFLVDNLNVTKNILYVAEDALKDTK